VERALGEGKRRTVTSDALLRDAQRMHRLNRLAEAKTLYRRTLELAPARPEAWLGLGMLAREVGVADAAVQMLGRAVELAPNAPECRVQYAGALQDSGHVERAAEELRVACRLRPDEANVWERLGVALQGMGDVDAAADAYRRAHSLVPSAATRIKLATIVSPIITSREAMLAQRARVEAGLDTLLAEPGLEIDDPMRAGLWSNFYLAFHGENNRALQRKYAVLYRRVCPSLDHVAPHCARPREGGARIRVGLVSKFFYNHSIGRTSRGLFAQLSRAEFEVTAIFVAPTVDDDYSRFIREHAGHTLIVPQDLGRARELIAELNLDVLFYQDIGMEPFTYFLGFSRLAPVQCVSFGHPDTTGVPAIDYFVSNDLYELPGADAHYSEQLFCLQGLGSLAYYYRPELPQPLKRRADFGLGEDDHLYLCPQNLFKFHPDMDALIAGILRRDALGRLVVIEGRIGRWTGLLRARWQAVMPDVADRIVFLPRQSPRDYVNLIALADVMLDTIHFNGMNTSLEAMSVGTPVVTLPGQFQRGRHTQAMYRRMGVDDCIASSADDYVERAVRLGTDRARREAVRGEILRRNDVLFEDMAVVREFERFFREAVARSAGSPAAQRSSGEKGAEPHPSNNAFHPPNRKPQL
jgi:predicted O-linked N-acetylglucosamine transferase (SPINDLY family)